MNRCESVDDLPIRVLGIGGSTRRDSKSLALLQSALHLAADAGAGVTLADVRALDLPIYDHDRPLHDYPSSLHELLAAARAADAYILCSPTYHGTVSGAVKNALDALNFLEVEDPPYLASKPVALMALGGGGAANVLNSLHHVTRALNGLSIPTTVIAHGSAIREGEISDEAVRRRLFRLVHELLDLAVRLRSPVASPAAGNLTRHAMTRFVRSAPT
jgi:FMN reductase